MSTLPDPVVRMHCDELKPLNAVAAGTRVDRLDGDELIGEWHDSRDSEHGALDRGFPQIACLPVEELEALADAGACEDAAGRLRRAEREAVARQAQSGQSKSPVRVDPARHVPDEVVAAARCETGDEDEALP